MLLDRARRRPARRVLLTVAVVTSLLLSSAGVAAAAEAEPGRPQSPKDHVNRAAKAAMKQNYPGALASRRSSEPVATDATVQGQQPLGVLPAPSAPTGETTVRRTATEVDTRHPGGLVTRKQYFAPQSFERDGRWTDIDSSLVEDHNPTDTTSSAARVAGIDRLVDLGLPSHFRVRDNEWTARFAPSTFPGGMVRVVFGKSTVGFAPVGARDVTPVITRDGDGKQLVRYAELWPNVDVEYAVYGSSLKESIVLKNKAAATSVSFTVIGARLKQQAHGQFAIVGALGDEFSVAPPNLILNNFGLATDGERVRQTYRNGRLSVSVDRGYLRSLPAKAFPAVIDPGVDHSTFGTRASGNYISFKTDGTICYSNVCNLYAGALFDANNILRYWRGAFFAPYDRFRNSGYKLTYARLHLTQRTNAGFWTGTYDPHTFSVGHATCLNNFNCVDGWWSSAYFGTSGDIDVTNLYKAMIQGGDFGAWLMVGGEDGTSSSFKNFDPDNSFVEFTYRDVPPVPTVASPAADNQVFVDPQVSFKIGTVADPNGGTVQYVLRVSSGPNGTGTIIDSGRFSSAQWTIPDGILQDGSTYYVQVQSCDPDPNGAGCSAWSASRPFRIDMRTGKDKTQTFDSLGPIDVDLATGNLSTSASSHTSAALGGSLGVGLDYNSPVRSRAGLVAEYWNVPSGYSGGTPTAAPNLQRVDQNVDLVWDTGSPSNGVITNDWFYGRWTGFVVVPTTGTYYFGGSNDDVLTVWINNQQVYSSGGCYSGYCYGSPVTLQAGQVVPLRAEYLEAVGQAYARLLVKGAVTERVLPQEWLQTGVRPVAQSTGLTGRYYIDADGTHTFSANNPLFLQRTDPLLSFAWGGGSPVPNGPADNFLIRWTGFFTAPAEGDYTFATNSDDGSRIYLGTNPTPILEKWQDSGGGVVWSTPVHLTTGQQTPIKVEYFEHLGYASMELRVQASGAVVDQVVPTRWLSPKAQVLPDGWSLGIDPDGDLGYEYLKANQNSAVLTDSTGSTHEYLWQNNGYKPPVNEDGQLVRNADGTFTLQDVDGRTYSFAADGTLTGATNPLDDLKPAALRYTYGNPTGGPAHIQQVSDGVDPTRAAVVSYSGDAACGSPPAGFDTQAPPGMVCAVKTNDARATHFFYSGGQLTRIARPGSDFLDFQYEVLPNGSARISGVRDGAANDAIAAGVRANDAAATTQIAYDILGRVVSVVQPAATAGATRTQHTVEYLPGAATYFGATQQHVLTAPEPNGFTRRVEYDNLFRTVKDVDVSNAATVQEWDPLKDLLFSTTDPAGLKSTTLYDDEDRAKATYGPAPSGWFNADRTPQTAHAGDVPHSDTAYDEGLTGPAVAWYYYKNNVTPGSGGSIFGAPKRHSTGLVGNGAANIQPNVVDTVWTADPFPAPNPNPDNIAGWAVSLTGKLRLPESGRYEFAIHHTEGARLWVNDVEAISDWNDGQFRTSPTYFLDYTAGQVVRLRLDHYTKYGTANPTLRLYLQKIGGFGWTTNWNTYLSPDYSLTTSTKTYDSQLGDRRTTTSFGTSPELGLAVATTEDQGGLNLTTAIGYEAQGAAGGFLRQTSKTLPGGNVTNYSHYGATETRDNPCTAGNDPAKQAGFQKLRTDPDPDGAGPKTSRVLETVYDDAGRPVATRANQDSWTCTTYDSRGRVTQTAIPQIGTEAGRTISNNWAVGGNPLSTAVGDNLGDITTTVDLLGRTVTYVDAYGNSTAYAYDALGRLARMSGDIGEQTFAYDSYGRLVEQKLDNVTVANVYYDAYSRVDHVDYPDAGQAKLTLGRDALGRENQRTYSQSATGPNIIPNPSLEQADPGDPYQPNLWYPGGWGDNSATYDYLSTGRTGGHSVRTEISTYTDGDAKWFFEPTDVSPSTTYAFKDYYKASAPTSVIIQYTHQDQSLTYQWLGDPAAAADWTSASYTFTTPSTVAKISVFHVLASTGWLVLDDAELTATQSVSSASVVDAVTRSQSGQILTDVVTSGSQSLWNTYHYDKADRLTAAEIGPHTYAYAFGPQNTATCGTGSATNADSGKNGNRTSQTIDGVTTTFCYDYADRLTTSSDPTSNYTEYDAHGNLTYIGTNALPQRLCYDSSDRNWCLVSYNSAGNGVAMYYNRDVTGRIISRFKNSITSWTWADAGSWYYGFTGSGDTPDLVRAPDWTIVEKNIALPGGVLLTVKPTETTQANKFTYSMPNMHGDTLLTTSGLGFNTSTGNGPGRSFTYDPFGNVLQGSTYPANADQASYGWVGQHQKLSETQFVLAPIQMGERVYFPTLGRFAQVDPIEGGGDNNYSYPNDPVNDFDLDGRSWWQNAAKAVGKWVWDHKVDIALTALSFVPVAGEVAWAARAGATAVRAINTARKMNATIHGAGRMMERGVTSAMARKAIERGVVYNDRNHPDAIGHVLKGAMASGRTLYISTLRSNGKIKTAILMKRFKPGNRWWR